MDSTTRATVPMSELPVMLIGMGYRMPMMVVGLQCQPNKENIEEFTQQ
jgi:hypothetical protein